VTPDTSDPVIYGILLDALLANARDAIGVMWWSNGKGADMANSTWKRLEKTPGYRKKKRFFKRLVGKELWLRNDIDTSVIEDGGWWYSPEGLDAESIGYSSASATKSISI
jgi:hypothetical protein